MDAQQVLTEMEIMSKAILYDIAKGDLKYEDKKVQYYLPIALGFTEWEWLELIAENTLIEEDAEIVKNFLKKAKALAKINQDHLTDDLENTLRKMM